MFSSPSRWPVRRRDLLRAAGAVGLLGLVGVRPATGRQVDESSHRLTPTRLADALRIRLAAARTHVTRRLTAHATNGDEARYGGTFATYTKGLVRGPHGEGDVAAHAALVAALEGSADFEDVPLGGGRRLVNPQAALSYNISGADPHNVPMDPAPAFESDEAAAEMVELYWQALLRDLPFAAYGTDPDATAAAAELGSLAGYEGPAVDAADAGALFRGTLPGDLTGPYVSQLLYHPVDRGDAMRQHQRFRVAAPGVDYLTDWDDWLAVQAGASPSAADAFAPARRYLLTGRDLATYVHRDYPFEAHLDAALVLLGLGAPLDANNPLADSGTQAPFVDFGSNDLLDAVTGVLVAVQHANWCHKWLLHRRLRPEEYGGRAEATVAERRTYPVPPALLDSTALARTVAAHGSHLLPQAYPEGAPLHPSYPAGHAGIAGACVTVLKAYFDEDWVFPGPVEPTADGRRLRPVDERLTLGGELNKLASNVSIGRNWAGIHYRSDAADGLRLGEERHRARTYDARYGFEGFALTTFDGERIRIGPDGAVPA